MKFIIFLSFFIKSISGNNSSYSKAYSSSLWPFNEIAKDNFTEPFLTSILDGVWNGSGDFSNVCIMADAARVTSIRKVVNGMAGDEGMTTDVSAGEIYNRIAIYQSQFGPVKVIPNKHMPTNQIYVLDMSSWGVAFGGG